MAKKMQIQQSFSALQRYICLQNGKLNGYICEDNRKVAARKFCQVINVNLIYICQLSQKAL